MEKQPRYVLRLSLEEMSLRKVVINLWTESDVLASIVNFRIDRLHDREDQNAWPETNALSRIPGFQINGFYGRENRNAWPEVNYLSPIMNFRIDRLFDPERQNTWQKAVENKVKVKVSELVLPEAIKNQMMNIVKPIGFEIRNWKRFHERYLSDSIEELGVPNLEKLCWTSSGMIEYKKTAEKLIRCEMMDIVKRYKLACLYCLEDYIPGLWEELPEEVKNTLYNKEDTSHIKQPSLPLFWPYILKGEEHILDNVLGRTLDGNAARFNQRAFLNSSLKGNKAAVEYFFQKLRNQEEPPLNRVAYGLASNRMYQIGSPDSFPLEKKSEVVCYLLSLITEQQQEVHGIEPSIFIRCFLDWPLQDIFWEEADLAWPTISKRNYSDILEMMRKAYIRSGYYFPKLFQEFFVRSPIEFRKQFLGEESGFRSFLPIFFDNEDSETIKVIFRNIDVDDRLKLVSSSALFNILDRFIVRDEWRLVELCLREATLSKEGRERLKGAFMEFLTDAGRLPLKSNEWKRFFQLLEEINGTTYKRSSEVETLTKAKMLCSEE